jgi:hypothetical protein
MLFECINKRSIVELRNAIVWSPLNSIILNKFAAIFEI